MTAWIRSDQAGVDRRIQYLRSHGLPVDPDTAVDDLRVHQDRHLFLGSTKGFPSSADFARRWGWSKTTAYRLLSVPEQWTDPDPKRASAWRALWNDRGTRVERPRNDGGTKLDTPTPETDETRNDSGTTVEREWNESGHRRGVVSSLPTASSSSIDECMQATPPAGSWSSVVDGDAEEPRPPQVVELAVEPEPAPRVPLSQRPPVKGVWATTPAVIEAIEAAKDASARHGLPVLEPYDDQVLASRTVALDSETELPEISVEQIHEIAAWAGQTVDRWWLGWSGHPGDKRRWRVMLSDAKLDEVLLAARRLAERQTPAPRAAIPADESPEKMRQTWRTLLEEAYADPGMLSALLDNDFCPQDLREEYS